jgi:predicted pyridoxine 5'-phosphate oxidase superfamily flavin-nucleotide-binding protein
MSLHPLPGSHGEHLLQELLGSVSRALSFYNKQMLDHLSPTMQEFIAEQEMFFLATADRQGECDCSFRAGEKGFVRVLGKRTLLFPEYRGNGVHASLGNILEGRHVGLLFVDFFRDAIGLHVNGKASICTHEEVMKANHFGPIWLAPSETGVGRQPELWVLTEVEEAFVHCSKHVPLLVKLPKEIDWGTDDTKKKGGDYFQVKHCDRPWVEAPVNGASLPRPALGGCGDEGTAVGP